MCISPAWIQFQGGKKQEWAFEMEIVVGASRSCFDGGKCPVMSPCQAGGNTFAATTCLVASWVDVGRPHWPPPCFGSCDGTGVGCSCLLGCLAVNLSLDMQDMNTHHCPNSCKGSKEQCCSIQSTAYCAQYGRATTDPPKGTNYSTFRLWHSTETFCPKTGFGARRRCLRLVSPI